MTRDMYVQFQLQAANNVQLYHLWNHLLQGQTFPLQNRSSGPSFFQGARSSTPQ